MWLWQTGLFASPWSQFFFGHLKELSLSRGNVSGVFAIPHSVCATPLWLIFFLSFFSITLFSCWCYGLSCADYSHGDFLLVDIGGVLLHLFLFLSLCQLTLPELLDVVAGPRLLLLVHCESCLVWIDLNLLLIKLTSLVHLNDSFLSLCETEKLVVSNVIHGLVWIISYLHLVGELEALTLLHFLVFMHGCHNTVIGLFGTETSGVGHLGLSYVCVFAYRLDIHPK